ncbi:PRC-barrel domain-containing protein [Ancylobacter sp.]|uniref:PRC-barrel domain-containing protein n=1 Tax=Ancylobacter sp. TaxID=1872567 RepID=UPI003D0EE18E
MDHTNHTRLLPSELTSDTLDGATIYGPDDEKIGHVSHLHGAGPAATVVVDVGGFLGIGAKPVALPIQDLDFMRDEDGDVHAITRFTKDQLKELPEHTDRPEFRV